MKQLLTTLLALVATLSWADNVKVNVDIQIDDDSYGDMIQVCYYQYANDNSGDFSLNFLNSGENEVPIGTNITVYTAGRFGYRTFKVTLNGAEQDLDPMGTARFMVSAKTNYVTVKVTGKPVAEYMTRVKMAVLNYDSKQGDYYSITKAEKEWMFGQYEPNTLQPYSSIYCIRVNSEREFEVLVNGKEHQLTDGLSDEVYDKTAGYFTYIAANAYTTITIIFGGRESYTVNTNTIDQRSTDNVTYKYFDTKSGQWDDIVSGNKYPVGTQIMVSATSTDKDRSVSMSSTSDEQDYRDVSDEISPLGDYYFYLTKNTELETYFHSDYSISVTSENASADDVTEILTETSEHGQLVSSGFNALKKYPEGTVVTIKALNTKNESFVSAFINEEEVGLNKEGKYSFILTANSNVKFSFIPAAYLQLQINGQGADDTYKIEMATDDEGTIFEEMSQQQLAKALLIKKNTKFRVSASTINDREVSIRLNSFAVQLDDTGNYTFSLSSNTFLDISFSDVEKPTGTSTPSSLPSQTNIKTIENGQIVIIKNGVKYDLNGRKL